MTFSGVAGDWNTSLCEIEDIAFQNVRETANENPIASSQGSAAPPCKNITNENV
jgi:galacturan 1,4-alpha-galacturonidase